VFHGAWDLFRWLENEGVTTSDGKWEHPQWDHGWEVEWSNTSANTQWSSERVAIDIFGDVFDGLSVND
jgi:hypothetical protein